MTSASRTNVPTRTALRRALVVLSVPVLALAAGVLSYELGPDKAPYVIAGAVLAIPVLLIMFRHSEAATLAALFIVYTNAADVAITFHRLPTAIGMASIGLLLIPLFDHLVIRGNRVILHPALPWFLAFSAAQVAGVAFSSRPDVTSKEVFKFMAEGLALYLVLTNVIRSPQTLRRACWTLLAAGTFLGSISVYQYVTGSYTNNFGGFGQVSSGIFRVTRDRLQARLEGSIGEENRYAQTMLMLVPIGVFMASIERQRIRQIAALVAAGVITMGMALTFSRGAALAFVLMCCAMTVMKQITKKQIMAVALGGVLLLLAVPEYALRLARMESMKVYVTGERGATLAERPDHAIENRLVEMQAAASVFFDHPIFGVGPGMFKYVSQKYSATIAEEVPAGGRESHNLYLGVLAENGILGFLFLGAIVYVTLRELARTRRRTLNSDPDTAYMATAFMLAIVCYLATGLTLHFAFVRFFWTIMALAACASFVAEEAKITAPSPLHKGATI